MFTAHRTSYGRHVYRSQRHGLHLESLEDRRVLAGDGDLELVRFQSATELESFLLNDSLARWQGLFGQPAWSGRWFGWGPEGDVVLAPQTDGSVATPPQQPDHSDTNVQVAGVDEDDIVETDGDHLYVLSGQELVIADAWQPNEMRVLSRVALSGQPIGQFLRSDRLTVISNTYDQSIGPAIDVIALDAALPFYQWTPPRTQITVIDVSDRAAPRIIQTTELDGWYVDSRAIGDFVYTVTSDEFGLPEPMIKCESTPEGDGRVEAALLPQFLDSSCVYETQDEYTARVAGHVLELGVPQYRSSDVAGNVLKTDLISQPTDIYKPVSRDYWNLLTVSVFDMAGDEPGPVSSTSVPTNYSSTVYGSLDSLYLVNPEWHIDTQQEATAVLKFDIGQDGTRVDLSGVGQVPGRLLNSFSLDEQRDGEGNQYLRIATTSGWGDESESRVYVLRDAGDVLETVGQTPALARGEQIFSVRFVGDTGYVVTFRQVDPLFAIDLSDPANPQVKGELHIPGFSNYLQPLRDDFLIGLGRNADPNTGRVQELQLSLFDVADLTSPQLADRYSFDVPEWAWSEALADHHAISYFPEHQVLTLPVSNDGWIWIDRDGDGGADLESYRPRTDLYVFRVQLPESGAADRSAELQFLGTITDDAQVRRSVRIEDLLYSISDNSVSVHPLLDPATLVAELHFGQEDVGVPVFTADRSLQPVQVAIETPEQAAPQVIDVFVGGTNWDPSFVGHLEAEGMASITADPWTVFPFAGADQLKIKFSEDVLIGANDLMISGRDGASYSFRDFTYDADTATAVWTLAEPIGADTISVRLRGTEASVSDMSGSPLDGDGDGTAGGTFAIEYATLPGDVDRDGHVDGADLALARMHAESALGDPDYSLEFDLDANGRIDAADLAAIQQRAGTTMPDYVPPISGDANQDGQFDSADLILVLARGKYRSGEYATWEDGDWNRDGLFDEGDLIRAFQEGHYADPAAAIAAVDRALETLDS
jgi:uncharacterized secreted protein with C-terminal beta-propeller domain